MAGETQDKSRDELVKDMHEKVQNENSEYLNEVAMPGVVVKVKE